MSDSASKILFLLYEKQIFLISNKFRGKYTKKIQTCVKNETHAVYGR